MESYCELPFEHREVPGLPGVASNSSEATNNSLGCNSIDRGIAPRYLRRTLSEIKKCAEVPPSSL